VISVSFVPVSAGSSAFLHADAEKQNGAQKDLQIFILFSGEDPVLYRAGMNPD
jgi:hypothetical protein